MPNRMLRDWTGSERISNLSVHAERFFVRLIMKVDDFGCFYADTRMLKANLFPLLLDQIREADLLRWMTECQKAGLIVIYESEGKRYLQIIDFKQRLDRKSSKFPQCHENKLVGTCHPHDNQPPPEVELEVEKRKRIGFAPPTIDEVRVYFLEKGYDRHTAEKAFTYYDSANWRDSRGKQVKNWKQKMIAVWFKEENKIQNGTSNLSKAVAALKDSQ